MSNDSNDLSKPNDGFKPGVSGNPTGRGGGRPKGSRDLRSKSERLLDRLMSSRGANLERIVDGVLKMAEAGETWAAKAVLDRCWAVPRGRMVRLNLGGDPAAAMDRMVAAIGSGDISADEGKAFVDIVRARAELIEAKDLEARLTALERGDAHEG
jgi:hypothetical protein